MVHLPQYEEKRLVLQLERDAAKTQSERNQLGQFATPTALALDIVAYAKRLLPLHVPVRFLDPDDVQFADALVSSTVVWFRKAKPVKGYAVEFTNGGGLNQPRVSHTVAAEVLHHEAKWTRLCVSDERRRSSHITLADVFTIKRGIATGANHFFILTPNEIAERGLPIGLFRPILPSPRYLLSDEIQADSQGDPILERRLFLLDCRIPEEAVKAQYPALWRYLETGKPEPAERYLCKTRYPWYSQEQRSPSPFLCTYMGRSEVRGGRPSRFILNHSRATAANVYLLLYPKPVLARALASNPELTRKVWVALNAIKPTILIGEGRVYGGGLHKLEPKELGNLPADQIIALIPGTVRHSPRQLELFGGERA